MCCNPGSELELHSYRRQASYLKYTTPNQPEARKEIINLSKQNLRQGSSRFVLGYPIPAQIHSNSSLEQSQIRNASLLGQGLKIEFTGPHIISRTFHVSHHRDLPFLAC